VPWWLRELKPDFKTVADFRKDNATAFKAVVREFIHKRLLPGGFLVRSKVQVGAEASLAHF